VHTWETLSNIVGVRTGNKLQQPTGDGNKTKEGFSQWALAHRALRQSRECLERAVTIVCRPQRRGARTRSCGV
jgi:hypothetical protein